MKSKIELCNMALANLGDKGTIENIDNPTKQTEIVCSKWYDVTRQEALRQLMPSFARKRDIWALDASYAPAFGYKSAYKYKSNCLKVLGIGNVYEQRGDYAIEDNHILIDDVFEGGLPVRYIGDVDDVSKWTPDFSIVFSWMLAKNICMELHDSSQKYAEIEQILPMKIAQFLSIDSQENKPVRVSNSNLMRRRLGLNPVFGGKA